MTSTRWSRGIRRRGTAVALCAGITLAAGCAVQDSPGGQEDPAATESSPSRAGGTPAGTTSPADTSVYTGPYDAAFREELSRYAGLQVTLTGELQEVVGSRSAYTLASTADPGLDPLLISERYELPEVEEGAAVQVTGVLREEFDPAVVAEAIDGDDASFYESHVGEPYVDRARGTPVGP